MPDSIDWWDLLEEATIGIKDINAMLAGETLSSEGLDDLTSAIASYNETIKIAKEHLGLL